MGCVHRQLMLPLALGTQLLETDPTYELFLANMLHVVRQPRLPC